ncbi:MAG: DUF87 domain-containing protein [Ignavibacteria bacterium]|jgi:hypothetical protein
MNIDIGCKINLERLCETRLLIQANSGGGKSYAIRKLLEETNGKIQQIVLDLEGEFYSLREKYDFVVFGQDKDYPIHIKYAERVAKELLKYNASAIIDLYELKHHERILYVKRFLDSMVNAPKELWHPCLVIIDEAHQFCPEKGNAESMNSVIDICTRGRKRGYCTVLATQRISKLHKDAAAECNNKLIGRTGLDIDMKRASEELGFTNKQDMLSLRTLRAGEFYAFGPAISDVIQKVFISKVKTTHPQTGGRIVDIPKANDKIKKILEKFKDLPIEAEKEIKNFDDLKRENINLKSQITQLGKVKPVDNELVNNLKKGIEIYKRDIEVYRKAIKDRDDYYDVRMKQLNAQIEYLLKELTKIHLLTDPIKIEIPKENIPKDFKKLPDDSSRLADVFNKTIEYSKPLSLIKYERTATKRIKESSINNEVLKGGQVNTDIKIKAGARRMLEAASMYYPESITKARIGAIAILSTRSGTFSSYMSNLRLSGLLQDNGNDTYTITEEGLMHVGEIKMPDNLVEMWCGLLKLGARRMLKELEAIYPEGYTKEELGERSEISPQSGTFSSYLSTLRKNGLVKESGGKITMSEELDTKEFNKY